MRAASESHYIEYYRKDVLSNQEAVQVLISRNQSLGGFIFWKNPEKPEQIQITYSTYRSCSATGIELVYATIYCLLDEMQQFGGMRALQKFISDRLLTLIIFDNDWTLTKYHTYYEASSCPRVNGRIDYSRMLRFPEVASVLQAIAQRPNLRMAIATGSDVPDHAKGILQIVFKEEWQQKVFGIEHGKKKTQALPKIISNLIKNLDESPVLVNGKLKLDLSDAIGLTRVLFVNDHVEENAAIQQLTGGAIKVIEVDKKSNSYLQQLNTVLELGLSIPDADLENNSKRPLPAPALEPKAKVSRQLFAEKDNEILTGGADSIRDSNGGTSSEYDDDEEEFTALLNQEGLSLSVSSNASPTMSPAQRR